MKLNVFFLICYLFMLIYYPPLTYINSLHFIGIISWLILILNYKNIEKTINLKLILKVSLVFMSIMSYLLIIILINSGDVNRVASYIFWLIDILPSILVIILIFFKNKYQFKDIFTILLIVGNIQGIFSIISFMFPSFQLYFLNKLIIYGYQERLLGFYGVRMFGFASNLNYTTPLIQAYFAIISLYFSIKFNWKYSLFSPLLIFSAVVNSRTSFVILFIGLILITIYIFIHKPRNIVKLILLLCIGGLIFNFIFLLTNFSNSATYLWIESGMSEIRKLISGNPEGYFSYLFNKNNYKSPPDFLLIFGTGQRSLGGNKYGFESDIGIINDIWLGGIIYMIIINVVFFSMIFGSYRKYNNHINIQFFPIMFLFIVVVLSYIKGPVYNMNEITTLILLLYLSQVLKRKDKVKLWT